MFNHLYIRPSTFGKEHVVVFSYTVKHRLTVNKLLVKKFGKEKIMNLVLATVTLSFVFENYCSIMD